jgi:hypothetical protein
MRLIGFAAFFIALLNTAIAHAERAVASGSMITIATFGSLDQACHSTGLPTINLLARPYGGVVVVKNVRDYSNFPTWNTRARCNTLKVSQMRIFYQSTPGFYGSDQVVFEVIFPETGRVRRFRVPISVR